MTKEMKEATDRLREAMIRVNAQGLEYARDYSRVWEYMRAHNCNGRIPAYVGR